MRTKSIFMLAIAGVMGLSISVGALRAQEAASQPGAIMQGLPGRGTERLEKIRSFLAELNLSEDQKSKIMTFVKPYREKLSAWRDAHMADIQKLREEFRTARMAKDRAQTKAVMQKVEPLLESIPKPKELIEQIDTVLTPEQRVKFDDKVKDIREKIAEKKAELKSRLDAKP